MNSFLRVLAVQLLTFLLPGMVLLIAASQVAAHFGVDPLIIVLCNFCVGYILGTVTVLRTFDRL